ncbi:MAG: OmpA family protein [Paracoccaceae bacterium]
MPKTPLSTPRTSRPWRLALTLAAIVFAPNAHALTLEFPGPATPTASLQTPLTSYRLPIGPWTDAGPQTRLTEGAMDQTAWRITAPNLTTLAIMQPLRAQLAADGWTVIFECETAACGGYDFRYGTEVLPEPDMHVDLGDFRYLAAERSGPDGPQSLSLMVSRSAVAGFVQLTQIGGTPSPTPEVTAPTQTAATPTDPETPVPPPIASGIAAAIETGGSTALDDLVFASGKSSLAPGDYASLAELATYLRANPDKTIALVGHTDASGGLAGNIALSRKRAQSVRQSLIDNYQLPAAQIIADGVGYLAPRASNLTEEGRTQNRRVEVMLTSTQ